MIVCLRPSWSRSRFLAARLGRFARLGTIDSDHCDRDPGAVRCCSSSAGCALRYISNDYVGIVEKLWSAGGSVPEGRIIALNGEAGYQAELLRGGMHFGLWRWQYRVHKVRLVTISQGKIGYVYARDGEPLPSSQTLGRVVACNNFQDARAFLNGDGSANAAARPARSAAGDPARRRVRHQPGAVRRHYRDARFTRCDTCWIGRKLKPSINGAKSCWQIDGFGPIVIGGPMHVADPLDPRANRSKSTASASSPCRMVRRLRRARSSPRPLAPMPAIANYHNNYQDAEAFLRAGGRRGRQYVPLTDGTYFINRWFASVELIPKTVVPIGYVGVVVSYYGRAGRGPLRHRLPSRRARGRRASAAFGSGRSGRANMRSTRWPAASCWCRRRTSCCTGSPARPSRIATTKV